MLRSFYLVFFLTKVKSRSEVLANMRDGKIILDRRVFVVPITFHVTLHFNQCTRKQSLENYNHNHRIVDTKQ